MEHYFTSSQCYLVEIIQNINKIPLNNKTNWKKNQKQLKSKLIFTALRFFFLYSAKFGYAPHDCDQKLLTCTPTTSIQPVQFYIWDRILFYILLQNQTQFRFWSAGL